MSRVLTEHLLSALDAQSGGWTGRDSRVKQSRTFYSSLPKIELISLKNKQIQLKYQLFEELRTGPGSAAICWFSPQICVPRDQAGAHKALMVLTQGAETLWFEPEARVKRQRRCQTQLLPNGQCVS